jgi:cell division protein FtsW (lipid II flippase)
VQFARTQPWIIPTLAVALWMIGLSGIWRAEELSDGNGRFFYRQLLWGGLAGVAFLFGSNCRYSRWLKWSYVLLLLGTASLMLVYWFPPIHGARRWLRLGAFAVQPSEFVKLASVFAIARYAISARASQRELGLLTPVLFILPAVLLIFREPDLGTALVFFPVLFAMSFAAGIRWQKLGFGMLVGLALIPTLRTQMSREQFSRISALFDQPRPNELVSDDTFHLFQSQQMMALGSWWGAFATDEEPVDQTVYRVPEPHTDSIISVLAEKHGVAGMVLTLALYAALTKRILRVAQNVEEPFGRLVAVGVAASLGVQVLINVGMMVGLLPITGLALPLISYGGSNLVATGLALGVVCNISRLSGVKKVAGNGQDFELPPRIGD